MGQIFLSNPSVTIYLLWALTIIVVGLCAFISWGLKRALDRLVTTIDGLISKQQILEIALTEQITTCEVCRESCPKRRKEDRHDV